jgi:uncharacterized membrane protein YoaK (UPF0700 family)
MDAPRIRPAERDALLMLLAVSAGSADGWSFFGLGHAFVANMTGNTVLIGLAVFQSRGAMFHPLLSLASYAIGVVIAGFLTRNVAEGSIWSKTVSRTLLIEAILLAGAEAAWAALHGHGLQVNGRAASPELNSILCVVAVAIGIQSGTMLRLKVPGIVTTYITGTWTTLLTGIVRLVTLEKRKPAGEKLQFEERLILQASIVAAYFLSAVLAGWLFGHIPVAVGAVSASSVLLVAAYGILRT